MFCGYYVVYRKLTISLVEVNGNTNCCIAVECSNLGQHIPQHDCNYVPTLNTHLFLFGRQPWHIFSARYFFTYLVTWLTSFFPRVVLTNNPLNDVDRFDQ